MKKYIFGLMLSTVVFASESSKAMEVDYDHAHVKRIQGPFYLVDDPKRDHPERFSLESSTAMDVHLDVFGNPAYVKRDLGPLASLEINTGEGRVSLESKPGYFRKK